MRLIFSRAAIVVFLITLAGVTARAAEVECLSSWDRKEPLPEEFASRLWPSGFRPTIGMCTQGYIHGTILKGDYAKVQEIFRNSYRTLNSFSLWSPGGDVGEAIKIGTLMRKYLMIAYAPHNIAHNIIKSDAKWNQLSTFSGDEALDLCTGPECVCASACALIWFGAVERLGFVGLHRPRIDDPMFKAFGPTDAAKAYGGVLDEIARYMTEMEVPRPLLDAMVATGSSEIRWIYSDDESLERPPSFAEWEDAACGPFTKTQSIINLGAKSHSSPLTAEEALLLKLLEEKQTKKIHCQGELRTSRREQLPPS